MMRRRTGAAIGADHTAKTEPIDHLYDKARQMLLGQPLVDRRRQKKRRQGATSRKLPIASRPPFEPNQWWGSSENQRRWANKSERLLGPAVLPSKTTWGGAHRPAGEGD